MDWAENGVWPVRTYSDFVVTRGLPLIDYPPERCDAVDVYDEIFHAATNDPRSIVIYADGSKSGTGTGAAWVAYERSIFSYPVLLTTPREWSLEHFAEIAMGWSPGHAGIAGNEIADVAAKKALTGMCRITTAVDFSLQNNCLIREIREEEWLGCVMNRADDCLGGGKSEKSERLVAQFITCYGLGNWIQRYGRVRILLWVTDSIRDGYLPRSIAARARPAATAEAIIDITEVATSDEIRKGRGFPKLPVINQDNIRVEEARRGIKLNVRPKLVEDEIKKLVAEKLALARTRDRRTKHLYELQKELEKTTAKVRKIFEAIRDGKKPKPPRSLPIEEQVRVRNRYDEIWRTFGHKTEAELAAEKLQKIEDRRRRGATFPKTPSRPRMLPQSSRPPTIEEIEAIEDKILKNPGLWIKGMEHPLWYYHGDKKELREFVIKMAAEYPVLRVDPNQVIQPEDIYSVMIEAMEEGGDQPQGAATGEESSTPSASVSKEGDKAVARIWEEYEERWSPKSKAEYKENVREDQIYSARKKLLKVYNRPYEPLHVDPKGDFFPHVPMTLLEMVPKVPHPSLSGPTPFYRESNWLTFEWLLRHLFMLRASSVSSALRSLAPGAENILADLPAHQRIPPTRRVRCLEVHDLVNLTMAWTRWPFRDPGSQFENHIERNFSSKIPVY
ncbi:hypothetical protein B9Z19DRAFT_1126173 [Tuber borchii]|uniref:Uncharacterized protein n=1 Tax=Tuber borchii TaxID=42251 RepID=A0A2T6ZTD2_TUBBO|nr:hypothetical protein B9Z19DRAFT_1126173 [Tuber borchii]